MGASGKILFLILGLYLAACSGSDGQSRSNSGNTAAKKTTPTVEEPSSGGTTSSLAFQALDFGPYLSAAVSGTAESHLAIEAGFLDIRKSGGSGAGDIKDYRAQSVTVMGGKSLVPGKVSSGCVEVTRMSAPGGAGFSSADSTGFYDGKLTFKDGRASVTKMESSLQFNSEKSVSLDVTAASGTVTVAEKPLPKQGAISFLGAFSASFGVNTVLEDMNAALAKSEEDLQIDEDGASEDINLAFVTFFPASAQKFIRCYVTPGNSVSLPKSMYTALAPFQAVTATFVSQDAEITDGTLIWRATYSGSGVEDLKVK